MEIILLFPDTVMFGIVMINSDVLEIFEIFEICSSEINARYEQF